MLALLKPDLKFLVLRWKEPRNIPAGAGAVNILKAIYYPEHFLMLWRYNASQTVRPEIKTQTACVKDGLCSFR